MNADLVLSIADQRNVQAAIRNMLVFAPHPTFTSWRLSVHDSVRHVVDADMAMSYAGTHQFDALISKEAGRIGEFPARAAPMIKKYDVFQRSEDLGVWTRSTLWGKHMPDFLRSGYYNEFARPLHSLDGVGISIARKEMHVGLQLHRDSVRGGGCGAREIALLRLLLPAFEVGIEMAMSYFAGPNGVAHVQGQPPAIAEYLTPSPSSAGMRHRPALTKRELQVSALLAARRSNYEIAELLHVSRATAKRHTENILAKLGLSSRREVERVINNS